MVAATKEQVKMVYAFLKESYGDKINGFKELDIDPDSQEITGLFRSGNKLFELNIKGSGQHSYKLVQSPADRADAWFDIESFHFTDACPEARVDAKKPQCTVGVLCGETCIDADEACVLESGGAGDEAEALKGGEGKGPIAALIQRGMEVAGAVAQNEYVQMFAIAAAYGALATGAVYVGGKAGRAISEPISERMAARKGINQLREVASPWDNLPGGGPGAFRPGRGAMPVPEVVQPLVQPQPARVLFTPPPAIVPPAPARSGGRPQASQILVTPPPAQSSGITGLTGITPVDLPPPPTPISPQSMGKIALPRSGPVINDGNFGMGLQQRRRLLEGKLGRPLSADSLRAMNDTALLGRSRTQNFASWQLESVRRRQRATASGVNLQEEIKDFARQIPGARRLSAGVNGQVYDLGNNRVMKIGNITENHDAQILAGELGLGPQIYAAGNVPGAAGYQYFEMDKIDGLRDLADVPYTESIRHVDELTEAIATMHNNGIYHGDLHVRNVGLDAGNKTRVLDYGRALLDPPNQPMADFYAFRDLHAVDTTSVAYRHAGIFPRVEETGKYIVDPDAGSIFDPQQFGVDADTFAAQGEADPNWNGFVFDLDNLDPRTRKAGELVQRFRADLAAGGRNEMEVLANPWDFYETMGKYGREWREFIAEQAT